MAEITDLGFIPKTQNEYFDDETQLYRNIDSNWNLEPSTPDGLKAAHDAEIFGNLDEVAQRAYNSKDRSKARGVELDDIGALIGSRRSLGTPSTVQLTLEGVPGTQILSGDLVDSGNNTPQWAINSNVVISSEGNVNVNATAQVNGAIEANVNTINRIVTTRGGWQSVTNPAVAVSGTAKQNDSSYRIEQSLSVGRPGNNQIDNLLGEILAVDGVRRAKVYENDTNSATVHPVDNPFGLPANSVTPIIDGGTNADVAFAIYIKKNPGVRLNQSGVPIQETVVSKRFPQNSKVIRFARPLDVQMTIIIDIENDGTLPSNVGDLITDSILQYTAGTLIPADAGFNTQGFDIGEDVPVNRMVTPVNQVIGSFGNSYINSIKVNGQTTGVVAINFNQLSRFTSSNITVVI